MHKHNTVTASNSNVKGVKEIKIQVLNKPNDFINVLRATIKHDDSSFSHVMNGLCMCEASRAQLILAAWETLQERAMLMRYAPLSQVSGKPEGHAGLLDKHNRIIKCKGELFAKMINPSPLALIKH